VLRGPMTVDRAETDAAGATHEVARIPA
jgi:hypothetical protein